MNLGTPEDADVTASKIERGRGLAAWRQIADAIGGAIRSGALAPGEQLSTEAELAARYGVNRHTARRALGALAAEGLVRAAQGRGTFVEQAPLPYPIGPRTRFTENLERSGHEAGGELLSAIDAPASAKIAERLGIAAGAAVVEARIRRFSDGVPVSVGVSRLPLPRFERFSDALRRTGSITKALKVCGVADYARVSTEISARVATPDEATALDLAPGRVVLGLEGLNVDEAGRPIQTVSAVFAADRVTLKVGG